MTLLTHPVFLLLMLLFALGLVQKRNSFSHFLPIFSFLAFLTLYRPVAKFVLGLPGFTTSIEHAVGYTSFQNYPKSVDYLAFGATLLVSILLGFGFSYWARNRKIDSQLQEPAALSKKNVRLFWSALVIAIVILRFPEISKISSSIGSTPLRTEWDYILIYVWRYFPYLDLSYFKDFWYPYGEQYNQTGPFPSDLLRAHIHSSTILLFMTYYFYIVSRKQWHFTLLALITFAVLHSTGYISHTFRYSTTFIILLGPFALRELQFQKRHSLIYGLSLFWVFHYEPNHLIYSAPALLLISLTFLLDPVLKVSKKKLLTSFTLVFAVFTIGVALQILSLHADGRLASFFEFYSQQSDIIAYGSEPSPLLNWFSPDSDTNNLFLLFICFSVLMGAAGLFTPLATSLKVSGLLLFSVGIYGAMVMLKQLVKPHVSEHVIAIFMIIGLLSLSLWSLYWSKLQMRVAVVGLFGLFIWLFVNGSISDTFQTYVRNPLTIPQDLKLLFSSKEELKAFEDQYFSKDYVLKHFPASREVVEQYLNLKLKNPEFKLFEMADESYIYVAIKETPPYSINLYNLSPLALQKRTVDWIENERVTHVLWKPSYKAFDSVAHTVRVPHLYQHVIRNFEFLSQHGEYHLLKRKSPRGAVDLNYWANHLGRALDLGALPILSSANSFSTCNEIVKECQNFLEIKAGPHPPRIQLQIEVNDQKFELSLHSPTSKNAYVDLERTWFWQAATSKDISSFEIKTDPPVKWELVKRNRPADILY